MTRLWGLVGRIEAGVVLVLRLGKRCSAKPESAQPRFWSQPAAPTNVGETPEDEATRVSENLVHGQ